MKQVLITLFAFAAITAFAQKNNWKQVQGNGNIQKENRIVGAFTAVNNGGSNIVEISYGETNSVMVEADENILPIITTTVKNGTLVIGSQNGSSYSSHHRLKVYITMSRVTGIEQHGSGNIIGSGNFYNDATTDIEVHGSGNIKLGFASFTNLQTSVHGSGNIELTAGKVENLDAATNGSGNLVAYAISSKNVKARTSGSGNVKVAPLTSLVAETSGSGNVYYKGSLSDINAKSSGSGKIVKQ